MIWTCGSSQAAYRWREIVSVPALPVLGRVKVGEEDLGGFVGGAFAGPHEVFSVVGEDGEDVCAVGVGDSGVVGAVVAHHVQLVVSVAVTAGGVDEVVVVGVPVWAPVDVLVVGELVFFGHTRDVALGVGGEVGDENLQQVVVIAVGAVDEAFAVGGEEGAAIVAGMVGDLDWGGAVGVHDVDIAIGGAEGAEDDPFAVGGECAFGVVDVVVGDGVGGEVDGGAGLGGFGLLAPVVGAEDFHAVGEGPAVVAAIALVAFGGFGGVFLAGGGGEDEGFAVGGEEAAGVAGFVGADADGFSGAGDAVGVMGETGEVHLVMFLAMGDGFEDDPVHVGREVGFAGTVEAAGELDDVGEGIGFAGGRGAIRGSCRGCTIDRCAGRERGDERNQDESVNGHGWFPSKMF